jgi:hypothetical protein
MAAPVVLTRRPRTEDELDAVVRTLFGYKIPRHKVCPDHDAPFDAFAQAYFRRDPQVLIRGSRGLSGKSRLLSVLGVTFAVVDGAEATILGGSLAQSRNVHDTIRSVIEYRGFNPAWLSAPPTNTMIRFANGATLQPLTASQRTVRGPHPPVLIGDELDEMDPEIWESAKGQPMDQRNYRDELLEGITIAASTLQYADKTMQMEIERFEEMGLPVYNWCYQDTNNPIDGWLSDSQIERKRREVSAERWRVEYDLGEPSIGNRAFSSEEVEAMFIDPVKDAARFAELWAITDPNDFTLRNSKEYQEYHFEDYRMDREYVIGADWAKERDRTVITVYDATFTPARVVHWVRFHHLSWPVMVKKFNDLAQAYRCGYSAIHDATGVGNMVNDYVDERAEGFIMAGQARDEMLYDYIAAVEHGKVIAPRVKEFYRATLYASTEDMFSRGKEFHLPDEVCSMALGWRKIDQMAPANINFEALERDANEESPFEKAIKENKQPVRAQDPDRTKPGRENADPVISFVG